MSNGRLTIFNSQQIPKRFFIICFLITLAVFRPADANDAVVDTLIKNTVKATRAYQYEKAYQLIKPYLNSKNERIQALIGYFYESGSKESERDDNYNSYFDIDKAVNYYRKAAEGRNANILFSLGMTLRKTVFKYSLLDPKRQNIRIEVFEIFLAAAEKGHPWAQLQVAESYVHGLVVERNYIQSYKWTLLASRRFDTDSGIGSFKGFLHKSLADYEKKRLDEVEVLYGRALAVYWERNHPDAIKNFPHLLFGDFVN